jgi:hypothetical protein
LKRRSGTFAPAFRPAVLALLAVIASLAALAAAGGCSYSFTGSSVPQHLRTIRIALFDDQTGSGEPALREQVTNRLIERFRQDNSLDATDQVSADCELEGAIATFTDLPTVVTAGESVQRARITIGVQAVFRDQKLKKTVYEKTFTAWGEYDIGADPTIRRAAITTAIDKVTEDILLETVSGW